MFGGLGGFEGGLDEREEERRRETTKLYLDFFKHFSTVASALAILFIALYSDLNLDPVLAAFGLIVTVGTVINSLIGLTLMTLSAGISKMTFNPGTLVLLLVLTQTVGFFLSVLALGYLGYVVYR